MSDKGSILGEFTFIYESFAGNCTIIDNPEYKGDNNHRVIGIASDRNKPLKFAFAPGKGLVLLDIKNGSIVDEDIFSKFISISSLEDFKLFTEKYGYLFGNDEFFTYQKISESDLKELVNRLTAVIELRKLLLSKKYDYYEILRYSLYILLGPKIIIHSKSTGPFTNNITDYISANSFFLKQLFDYKDIAKNLLGDEGYKIDGKFHVSDWDLVYPEQETDDENYEGNSVYIDWDFYNDVMKDDPGSYEGPYSTFKTGYFRACLTHLINSGFDAEKDSFLTILFFLYHLQMANTGLSYVSYSGFSFKGKDDNNTVTGFDQQMKDTLIKVARIAICYDINTNIKKIQPICNKDDFEPSWKINNLMEAIYFSLFYQKPELVIYKKCANPECGKYFMVRTTATNKKFCSPECGSINRQRMYRFRHKNDNK